MQVLDSVLCVLFNNSVLLIIIVIKALLDSVMHFFVGKLMVFIRKLSQENGVGRK